MPILHPILYPILYPTTKIREFPIECKFLTDKTNYFGFQLFIEIRERLIILQKLMKLRSKDREYKVYDLI